MMGQKSSIFALHREKVTILALSLSVYTESRLDGRSFIAPVEIDTFGEGRITAPHNINQLALEVSCTKRGLLAMTNFVGYFKTISFESRIVGKTVQVEFPVEPKARDQQALRCRWLKLVLLPILVSLTGLAEHPIWHPWSRHGLPRPLPPRRNSFLSTTERTRSCLCVG